MRRAITLSFFVIFLISGQVFCQDSLKYKADIQFGADLMSRYLWRGLDVGGGVPAIQPTVKFNVGNPNHQFSLSAWGSYPLSTGVNQEIDLTAAYTCHNMLTFMVCDYFFPGLNTGPKDKYFSYRQDSTGHVFEGCVMFNGTEKIPFTLMVATNFYGNDARKMKQTGDSVFVEDGLQYSTYIELGYKARIRGIDVNAFIGGTINNPDESRHETGYYLNDKAGITNLGLKVSKGIPVTDRYSIPVQASLIVNPMQNKVYLVFGLSF